METNVDVKSVRVDYRCPECKKGYLRPSGTIFTTEPPQYPHNCNNPNCKYGQTFNKSYPYIDWVEIFNGKTKQEIVDDINYHNGCAYLTIGDVPEVTIEDIFKE